MITARYSPKDKWSSNLLNLTFFIIIITAHITSSTISIIKTPSRKMVISLPVVKTFHLIYSLCGFGFFLLFQNNTRSTICQQIEKPDKSRYHTAPARSLYTTRKHKTAAAHGLFVWRLLYIFQKNYWVQLYICSQIHNGLNYPVTKSLITIIANKRTIIIFNRFCIFLWFSKIFSNKFRIHLTLIQFIYKFMIGLTDFIIKIWITGKMQ